MERRDGELRSHVEQWGPGRSGKGSTVYVVMDGSQENFQFTGKSWPLEEVKATTYACAGVHFCVAMSNRAAAQKPRSADKTAQ